MTKIKIQLCQLPESEASFCLNYSKIVEILMIICMFVCGVEMGLKIRNSSHPRKYWTFVMSWHKDQWRNDLVVICMKTCNLGIYLNFKNLSKTWHVNTNREQIHNGLFLSIHFHLLSNVMLFVKLKYAKKWWDQDGILSLLLPEKCLRGDNPHCAADDKTQIN